MLVKALKALLKTGDWASHAAGTGMPFIPFYVAMGILTQAEADALPSGGAPNQKGSLFETLTKKYGNVIAEQLSNVTWGSGEVSGIGGYLRFVMNEGGDPVQALQLYYRNIVESKPVDVGAIRTEEDLKQLEQTYPLPLWEEYGRSLQAPVLNPHGEDLNAPGGMMSTKEAYEQGYLSWAATRKIANAFELTGEVTQMPAGGWAFFDAEDLDRDMTDRFGMDWEAQASAKRDASEQRIHSNNGENVWRYRSLVAGESPGMNVWVPPGYEFSGGTFTTPMSNALSGGLGDRRED